MRCASNKVKCVGPRNGEVVYGFPPFVLNRSFGVDADAPTLTLDACRLKSLQTHGN